MEKWRWWERLLGVFEKWRRRKRAFLTVEFEMDSEAGTRVFERSSRELLSVDWTLVAVDWVQACRMHVGLVDWPKHACCTG
ncbi:hypothetical protein NL676_006951 [Syzygium grande]|nr:hypothetical protein NL676_006947 [Syzygium grande]KAI6672066.1 hypothetical protein NL676_006951 [Syzygium grande]